MTHVAVCCNPAVAIPGATIRMRTQTCRRAGAVKVPPTDVFPQFGFDGVRLFTPTPHWAGVIVG